MVDYLPRKIKSNRIGTRMLEGHKFPKKDRGTRETLLIHLLDLIFSKIMWSWLEEIKRKMKFIS